MQFSQLSLMYLLMGLGVMIGHARLSPNRSWGTLLGACVFWPLFVPFLLGTPQSSPVREPSLDKEAAIANEALSRLLALTTPDSLMFQKVLGLRTVWNSQVRWLAEATQLLEKPAVTRTPAVAVSAASIELRAQVEAATMQLKELFSGVQELGVEVQLWKRSEDSVERIEALICERLDRLSRCVSVVR